MGRKSGVSMTNRSEAPILLLTILFAAYVPIYAQTGIEGSWQAEGRSAIFVLTVDGSHVTGMAGSDRIYDGSIEGNAITIKWKSADGDRINTATGRVNADEIVFSREVQVREGGNPGGTGLSGLFGPTQFILKRLSDSELAKRDAVALGMDVAAAVNVHTKDVKAEGTLFIPLKVSRARIVLVVIDYGLGFQLSVSEPWRKLAETVDGALLGVRFSKIGPSVQKGLAVTDDDGREEALLGLLQRLVQESGHRELTEAPLLFWGHSAAVGPATIFSERLSERTVAFVHYHSGAGVKPGGMVSKIPALFLAGAKDDIVGSAPAETAFKNGRSIGAPWTLGIEPNATHDDPKDLERANSLMIPWITAIVRQRLSSDGALRAVTNESAWLGNVQTGEVASHATFAGSKAEASWLPDEVSARAWQSLVMGRK
jgi:hypothetical protein